MKIKNITQITSIFINLKEKFILFGLIHFPSNYRSYITLYKICVTKNIQNCNVNMLNNMKKDKYNMQTFSFSITLIKNKKII